MPRPTTTHTHTHFPPQHPPPPQTQHIRLDKEKPFPKFTCSKLISYVIELYLFGMTHLKSKSHMAALRSHLSRTWLFVSHRLRQLHVLCNVSPSHSLIWFNSQQLPFRSLLWGEGERHPRYNTICIYHGGIEWVATAAESLTSDAPELHPRSNANDTVTNPAFAPATEMNRFGASPPSLIGRWHHSGICPDHLKALNIPRLKSLKPQGQRLREWLLLFPERAPYDPHYPL